MPYPRREFDMEDKKLMNTNNTISKKRKGFALILALIVVGVGLIIVAFMFNYVSSFTRYFSQYRQTYLDTATARSYVEKIKGYIVHINNHRGTVLHGQENQNPDFPANTITSLNGLLISGDSSMPNISLLVDEIININGPQRVQVHVYDANYSVEGISDAFPHHEIYELPPSFYIAGGSDKDWVDVGDDGSDYNKFDEDPPSSKGAHGNYGAYLIRVRIYNTATTNRQERLVRITEEAFVQVIP